LVFKQITAEQIHQFLIEHTSGWKPASVHDLTVALRSFFRFLEFGGLAKPDLSRYVPHPCPWPLSQPPRTLGPEEQKTLLESFDRSIPAGKRDYAIALCCTELGLRACEVASLTLEDIDWRELTLRVQYTKQQRRRMLPLPSKVARAIADYLRSGRPETVNRSLFVRHRFPMGKPLKADGLRDAVSRGFERAGMSYTGTHILRHTWATRALQRGHTLKQIADILGHLSINTTSRYAHLNVEELREAVLPWPADK
jgi:site-specific recombinase XerD